MIDIAAKSIQTPAIVYVRTNGRVSPQLWHEPISDIEGYWRGRIVDVARLVSDAPDVIARAISVDRSLTSLFPPPALKEED